MKVRRKKKAAPTCPVCPVPGCGKAPMDTTGVCFDHWVRVPIDLRWAIWNNPPRSPKWEAGVRAIAETYLEKGTG